MLRTYTYQNQSNSLFANRNEITFANFSFTQGIGPFFSQPIPPPVDPGTDISHYKTVIVSVSDYSLFVVVLLQKTLNPVRSKQKSFLNSHRNYDPYLGIDNIKSFTDDMLYGIQKSVRMIYVIIPNRSLHRYNTKDTSLNLI